MGSLRNAKFSDKERQISYFEFYNILLEKVYFGVYTLIVFKISAITYRTRLKWKQNVTDTIAPTVCLYSCNNHSTSQQCILITLSMVLGILIKSIWTQRCLVKTEWTYIQLKVNTFYYADTQRDAVSHFLIYDECISSRTTFAARNWGKWIRYVPNLISFYWKTHIL